MKSTLASLGSSIKVEFETNEWVSAYVTEEKSQRQWRAEGDSNSRAQWVNQLLCGY
jgi:hypothetical protein